MSDKIIKDPKVEEPTLPVNDPILANTETVKDPKEELPKEEIPKEEVPKEEEVKTTKEEYEKAKLELDRIIEIIQRYEETIVLTEEEEIEEVIEKGEKTIIEWEEIPGRDLLRVTKLIYKLGETSVSVEKEYVYPVTSNSLLALKSERKVKL